MTSDVVQHYSTASESDRLARSAHGRLELLRTQGLIRRVLTSPAKILDVGGGTGVHARWLAADGHSVRLIDPVPEHISMAAALPGVLAEVGDARRLPVADHSVDAVLLLGPLYHLTEPADRTTALREAVRVLRPGGILIAAAISRYLSALECGANGTLDDTLIPSICEVISTGEYDGHVGFLRTHWHTADELRGEIEAAGLREVQIYGIEGPTWPALDRADPVDVPALMTAALRCARLLEQDPDIINTSAHLLAIARAA
ncbi:class I SAM-dependent methyltransferase [Nocardia cerradoensis]|uniref:class I SAM-dependent methyltransferase n=1 Tax=Nocardia cerradoensis TaxID=85688 RepID=UPI0002DCF806|nr:class I SAM-dependent methyltransferase [Nocardia cerradoensis]NKY43799.1 methyltransferase domain-containing protein [Nocardia cerradoensis]